MNDGCFFDVAARYCGVSAGHRSGALMSSELHVAFSLGTHWPAQKPQPPREAH
jgi:hypothetical protein